MSRLGKIGKLLVINIAIFLVTCLIMITVLELVVRSYFPHYDPRGKVEFYINSEGVTLGIPNSITRQWVNTNEYDVEIAFNKYGFRDVKDLKES